MIKVLLPFIVTFRSAKGRGFTERNLMASVDERVKAVVSKVLHVNPATIKPEHNFATDLGAESVQSIELVAAFEEEFGIEIPDESAEKITRVKEAIDYIEAHAKSKK
jgi:acyl carrier protein